MKTETEYKRMAERFALAGQDDLASAYVAVMDCARRDRERRIRRHTEALEIEQLISQTCDERGYLRCGFDWMPSPEMMP